MKKFIRQVAHGDILLERHECDMPAGFVPANDDKDAAPGDRIIAHSESGHHHVVEREKTRLWVNKNNPMISFLELLEAGVTLEHRKSGPDAHEAVRFDRRELIKVTQQVEKAPRGWVKARD